MGRSEVLIGIDAGTSVVKAVAFDADGEALASRSRPNAYTALANGGVEQDMRRTLADAFAVVAELVAAEPELAARVVGLAVTGQGDGTWLVDAAGEPVHEGWLWLDSRSATEARELERLPGYDLVYERTGTGVNVCQTRAHFAWMKKHAPELLARAATAFHCKDWLYLGLTGERATDPGEGVFTFGSLRRRDYDDDVIAALEMDDLRHLLPPIVDGTREHAPLTAEAARATGLPEGLPVTLGYLDVICTALGGGLYSAEGSPGLSILGSTGMHMRLARTVDDIVLNEDRSGYTVCFPGGGYAQMQSNMAATLNIDWIVDIAVDAARLAGADTSREQLLPRLDDAVESVRRLGTNDVVSLSVSTSLANFWLLPRLPDFKRRHPDIDLRVITTDSDDTVGLDDADLWIPLGLEWPRHLEATLFRVERIVPVATPSVAEQLSDRGRGDPVSLMDAPLLHLEERYSPRYNWNRWFSDHGVSVTRPLGGYRSNDYSLVLQAALDGQGIALGWVHIVTALLGDGRLVALAEPVETSQPFPILQRRGMGEIDRYGNVEAFRHWLRDTT